ncbi:hypothetical protein BJX62DRAFT_251134 [Aspergillus germanicus]
MARDTVNLYCPICGIILFPDRYLDRQVFRVTRARLWYAEIRAIYSTDISARQIAITGRGLISRQGSLYAPRDESLSYLDAGSLSLEKWPLCRSSETSCAFGFHSACWRLLLLRLGYIEDEPLRDETHVVKSMFLLLYCTLLVESRSFDFGHDYERAAKTHRAYRRPRVDPSSALYADPFAIPSLDDLEAAARMPAFGHPSAGDDEIPPWFLGENALSLTGNLGAPRCIVFPALSLELKLHILSYLSFDELLNARFVCRDLAPLARMVNLPRSSWRSRLLLGQEAEFLFANLTEQVDWKRVFFGTRASLCANTLPLVNRKRISALLEPIAALLQHEGVFWKGPMDLDFTPGESEESAMHVISGSNNEDQSLFLDITSFFNGDIADIDANNILHKGCRVLYHKAQPLVLPGQQCLRRIGVSFVRIGARRFISGLNMHLRGRSISHPHVWIGDTSSPGVARGMLKIPGNPNQSCLFVGLDSYKVVSLGIGRSRTSPESPTKASSEGEMDPCCIQSYVWATHPPLHDGLSISSLWPELPRRFEPVLNIDFGGQAGSRLTKVTRFVSYMASRPVPLCRTGGWLLDGEPMLFGSKVGCTIPFFIDGAGGERIVQVGALRGCDSDNLRLAGLQNIPLPTLDSIITGFIMTQTVHVKVRMGLTKHHSPRLKALGPQEPADPTRYQAQECSKQAIAPQMLDHDHYHIPPHELRYDHDHFAELIGHGDSTSHHTYASLKHVRKINYYNHSTPEVVGQWMEELDDGFELASDENVRLLTICLKPVRNPTDNPAMEPGQVVSLHIETTRARSYQSDADGSLIAIIWMLNLSSGTDDLIFVPDLQPPYNQMQTIYFDRASANGSKENVNAVEAYFRDRTITGLDFVYTSGRKFRAGDLESDTHEMYHFPPNARINRVSATTVKEQLTELQFEIERETDPSQVRRLVCSIKSSDDAIGGADPLRDHTPELVGGRGRAWKAPRATRLVGMTIGCTYFSKVGVVYEPDGDQQGE